MSKRLLILTGPQGSGNHLWARIFSSDPSVVGWTGLLDSYWQGHDREPMAEYWRDPESLTEEYFAEGSRFVTSISCPYFHDGALTVPNYRTFFNRLDQLGVRATVAILTRDGNIVRHQQKRVRGEVTIDMHKDALEYVMVRKSCTFLSLEALLEWGDSYLRWCIKSLDWDLEISQDTWKFIDEHPNAKYVKPISSHWLDETTRLASMPKLVKGDDL
jgi:hypothetical protein